MKTREIISEITQFFWEKLSRNSSKMIYRKMRDRETKEK